MADPAAGKGTRCTCEGKGRRLPSVNIVLLVTRGHADVASNVIAYRRRRAEVAAGLEGFVGEMQPEPMLRIHELGLPCRFAEEGAVEGSRRWRFRVRARTRFRCRRGPNRVPQLLPRLTTGKPGRGADDGNRANRIAEPPSFAGCREDEL